MTTRYHSLDLWRGVACLMVAVLHTAGDRHGHWLWRVAAMGYLGVPLFFVISGYCISAAAESHVAQGRTLRQFAWRRWRRIFPPYFAAIALAAALVVALQAAGRLELLAPRHGIGEIPALSKLSAWQWFGSLTLIEQWRPRLVGSPAQWFLGHAWTLGYEEQFYIVMGLLAWGISRRWLAGALGVTVATVAAMAVFPGGEFAGTFLNGYWLPFACGVAVYAARVGYRWPILPLAILAVGVWWVPTIDSRFALSLSVGAVFALVLILLQPYDARLSGTRWLAPLHWCGVRCYTVYLIHWPIVKLTEGTLSAYLGDGLLVTFGLIVPAALGLTLLAAAPFHAYIERPCMGLRSPADVVRPPAPSPALHRA